MNSFDDELPYTRLNIIVIGMPDVGKSALVKRFVTGEFNESRAPSFRQRIERNEKSIEINDAKINLNIHVFDFGESQLREFKTEISYTNCFMAVYDPGNQKSYEAAIKIAEQLSGKEKYVMLVATKSDQVMIVDNMKAKEHAESNGWMFCATSAATNVNVESAFKTLVRAFMPSATIAKMHDLSAGSDRLKEIGKSSSLRKEYLHLVDMIETFNMNVECKAKKEDCCQYIETVRKYAEWLAQQEEKSEQKSKSGQFAAKFIPDKRIQRICEVLALITNDEISKDEFDELINQVLSTEPSKFPRNW